MTIEEIERLFIVEFSTHGNAIGLSKSRNDRRERCRGAIYMASKAQHKFHDTQLTYAEAFERCFNERMDRRAAVRETPADEPDDEVESIG